MTHWWVNHKQTSRQEISGGYLWSPKRESNGNRSQFYEFMRETRPGDTVVSYANTRIGHFGIIKAYPMSAPKPKEFGSTGSYWSNDGWLVPVEWHPVIRPFRPKDYIESLRALLPENYAPIQQGGNGNQKSYLTKIGGDLFNELKLLGQFDPSVVEADIGLAFNEHYIDQTESNVLQQIEQDLSLSDTDRTSSILARRGQGIFRRNVEKIEQRCRVTGLKDRRLLTASHIKPWRSCETAQERLDGFNGLMLAPQIDRLFDIGLITFEKNGNVVVSKSLSEESQTALALASAVDNGVGSFSDGQEHYLRYHRTQIFLG